MTERMTAADLHAMQGKSRKVGGKRRDVEGPIHRSILAYVRRVLPARAVIHHSPNEMNLHADPKAKSIAQAKAKALGMVPGWPDLEILMVGFYGIEVKTDSTGQSDTQKAVEAAIVAAGGKYGVARSIDDAEKLLREWGLI